MNFLRIPLWGGKPLETALFMLPLLGLSQVRALVRELVGSCLDGAGRGGTVAAEGSTARPRLFAELHPGVVPGHQPERGSVSLMVWRQPF